jgi:hypothetical protein
MIRIALVETFWIRFAGSGSQLDTYICTVYAPGPQRGNESCQSFYALLTEQCVHYSAVGDILLLGDFNARIGQISGDTAENGNCRRFLEFLGLAFSDGADSSFKSLLNCSGPNKGRPTRFENGHASVLDYIITNPSCRRAKMVHVECIAQDQGANGLGSDHNLLWVDWKQKISPAGASSPRALTQPYRLCWDKNAFSDPGVVKRYQSLITPALCDWSATVSSFMSAPFLQSLPESECQILLNGLYASWFFIVHTALCCSIPIKSVGPHSKSWWDPGLQVLLDQRSAAYSALVAYTKDFNQASLSPLPADPIWQDLR